MFVSISICVPIMRTFHISVLCCARLLCLPIPPYSLNPPGATWPAKPNSIFSFTSTPGSQCHSTRRHRPPKLLAAAPPTHTPWIPEPFFPPPPRCATRIPFDGLFRAETRQGGLKKE